MEIALAEALANAVTHGTSAGQSEPIRVTASDSAAGVTVEIVDAGKQVPRELYENVAALDARNVSALQNVYDAEDLDFRLRPGSAAVDRGMVLPSVTDGFTGSAPDLGALEVGGAAPHYGPRD